MRYDTDIYFKKIIKSKYPGIYMSYSNNSDPSSFFRYYNSIPKKKPKKESIKRDELDRVTMVIFPKSFSYSSGTKLRYSFDELMLDSLEARTREAENIFNIGQDLTLSCTLNSEKGLFVLESELNSDNPLMRDVYLFLKYVESIDSNPGRALDGELQNAFIQASDRLKKEGILLKELYGSKEIFFKAHSFNSISKIDNDLVHLWRSNGNFEKPDYFTIRRTSDPFKFLSVLGVYDLVKINEEKLLSLKLNERETLMAEFSGSRLQQYAGLYRNHENAKLLSVDGVNFEDALSQLWELGIIQTIPELISVPKEHAHIYSVIERTLSSIKSIKRKPKRKKPKK